MQEGIFNEIEYQEFGDTRNPKGFSEDNYNKHNPKSSLLIGEIEDDDIIKIRR